MKFARFVMPVILSAVLSVALLSVASVVLAQSTTTPAAPSDAEKSFTLLKTLAGTWQGPVTTVPKDTDMEGKPVWISLRVTSHGNTIVHEMKQPGTPDDPNHDDPITMLYLDGERLLLTHYCDAGNRPRMAARTSPDGKTVEFDFVDVAGGTQYGHMHHAVFTVIDANHHIEDWTYMTPEDKPIHARLDLQRTK
jgi:phage tail protein X